MITIRSASAFMLTTRMYFLFFLLIALSMVFPLAGSAEWQIETVDSENAGRDTSIAVDSSDNIHISHNSGSSLKYSTNSSGLWANQTIDGPAVGGTSTSIAIDSLDKVHISYHDYYQYDLKYVTNISGSWINEMVDTANGEYTSIAIDSSDNVHISFYNNTSDLNYTTNSSGSWVTETVDSAGRTGMYTSIAIDSSGNVHISYCDWDNADLKYATNASGSWDVSLIDSAGYVGKYYTSIAIDSLDNVHISYYDGTNKDLKYATNASGSWVTETIDNNGDVGRYSSIAVNSSNVVYISYRSDTEHSLKYATNASGSWVSDTVDNSGDVYYSSLAIDSTDSLHIGYYDGYPNKDLKYAANFIGVDNDGDGYSEIQGDCNDSDAEINPDAAEVCDGIDNDCDGEVDEGFKDKDHDGYAQCAGDCDDNDSSINPGAAEICDGIDNNCDSNIDEGFDSDSDGYTTCSGDCNDSDISINPGAVEVCDGIDNNCDSNIDEGFPDIDGDGYTTCGGDCDDSDPGVNPGEVEIPYNGKDDDCNAVTPDDDLDVDGYTLSTDCDDADSAINPSATEICDLIDNNCNSLIDEGFDSDGDGYTACGGDCDDTDPMVNPGQTEEIYNNKNDDCDQGTSDVIWDITTIDSTGDVGKCSSIANDLLDNAHISYYDETNGNIKYATNASGSWVTETVDAGECDTSIAVDSRLNAHIFYCDTGLKHATNASGSWISETLDEFDCSNVSAVMDSHDNSHIVYIKYGELIYLTDETGLWTSPFLMTDTADASIAAGLSDSIHISYVRKIGTMQYLRYATNKSGSWSHETIKSYDSDPYYGPWLGWSTSIGVNSMNRVYIGYSDSSFHDYTSTALSYATNISGTWQFSSIDYVEYDQSLGDLSVAVDSRDKIHFNYFKAAQYFYKSNAYGLWTTETVQMAGPMSIDSSDFIHISYYSDSSGDLKYATTTYFTSCSDDDGDGHGSGAPGFSTCRVDRTDSDCDDSDINLYPGGPPIRIYKILPEYYLNFQNAYDAAGDDDIIQTQARVLGGDTYIDLNKSVTINGGYDCTFTDNSDITTVNGDLVITNGTVTIMNLKLQ